MPKHPFPATGEAMPVADMNRRAVLTGAGATAAALAASTIPAEPATVETASDTIKRAGKEIAEALNHYDGGKWHALIYPSEKVKDGLWLGNRMEYVGLQIEEKLVALIQKWRKAKEAEDRAADAYGKAETRYFAKRGKFEARPTPDHLFEARQDMTLRELGDRNHPVNLAFAVFNKEEEQRRDEWEAQDECARKESGSAKAEARHVRAVDRTNRAFFAIMEAPAGTLEGIRRKVEVINEQYRHDEIERDVWELIAADIMQAPGYVS